MTRVYGHSGGAAPRRTAGILLHPSRIVVRSLGLILTLALLLAGFVHAPLGNHVGAASNLIVAAAEQPSHEPCGSHDGAAYGHLLCGMSVSCFACALVDAAVAPARDQGTIAVPGSDVPHRGREAKPPFHPPKLLVIA
jgi:hypothetical protein